MAWFFSKKRSDGNLVTDGDPMQHIMPYLMRGRNESAIYFKKVIDVDNIQSYIRKQRKEGRRITAFNIIVAAVLNTFYRRPHLNRFVAGRRIYEHKATDVSYTVKRDFTDEAGESVAHVILNEHDNLFDVADKMTKNIMAIKKESEEKADDKLMNLLQKFPRWALRFIVSCVRWMDFHGILPESLQEIIPLYSSVYLSHIGSLGAEPPFHHLYEFGTTSIFITVGKIYNHPRKNINGEVEWFKAMDLMFTVDERICDGFYLIKSLRLLEDYLTNPELLEVSPYETRQLDKRGLQAKLDNHDSCSIRDGDLEEIGLEENQTNP